MSAFKLQTFWQNQLRSTTFKVAIVMVGSPTRFARDVMACPRLAFLPTISSNPTFLLKDITRPNPPQASGATNGVPSNSASLSMTFWVEYVGLEHFNDLRDVLKKLHGVQFNMAGNKFVGIDIKWDYATHRYCISMPGYIENPLIKFNHPRSTKPRLLLHKCLLNAYGDKAQLTPMADTSEQFNLPQKGCIQEIVGLLLYYA